MNRQTAVAPTLTFTRCRGWVAIAFLFSIFTNILVLTGPLFMLQVYDRVLSSRSEETLVALFGLVAGLYVFYGLIEFARGRVLARVGARFQTILGPYAFGAALRRAAIHPSGQTGGQAAQELETIRVFMSGPVMLALLDIPWTPVFLAAIFIFHPLLGWLAIGGGSALVLVALANQWMTAKDVAAARQGSHTAAGFANQANSASEFIWAQGMLPDIVARWQSAMQAALVRSVVASDKTGGFTAFTKAFRLFLQSAMLALGAWLVLQDQLTAGAMIAGSVLLGRALAPVETALAQWHVVQNARVAAGTLARLLDEHQETAVTTGLPKPAAALRINGISVLVSGVDRPVLRNVSFDLTPGHALGVIGNSGSGKTTLARAILGLVQPATGDIRLDGATTVQYGARQLGRLIGYLPQSVQFFDATVAENIAHMAQNPNAAMVVEAAKKSNVHEVILQLAQGYDTRIGPLNSQLSGGQIQRLALARALFARPQILILDEPNSALDAEGTEALNSAIKDMKSEQKSIIVMNHRPAAISTCDDLLVLQRGGVAAYGPRDEIIRSMMKNAAEVEQVLQQSVAS